MSLPLDVIKIIFEFTFGVVISKQKVFQLLSIFSDFKLLCPNKECYYSDFFEYNIYTMEYNNLYHYKHLFLINNANKLKLFDFLTRLIFLRSDIKNENNLIKERIKKNYNKTILKTDYSKIKYIENCDYEYNNYNKEKNKLKIRGKRRHRNTKRSERKLGNDTKLTNVENELGRFLYCNRTLSRWYDTDNLNYIFNYEENSSYYF